MHLLFLSYIQLYSTSSNSLPIQNPSMGKTIDSRLKHEKENARLDYNRLKSEVTKLKSKVSACESAFKDLSNIANNCWKNNSSAYKSELYTESAAKKRDLEVAKRDLSSKESELDFARNKYNDLKRQYDTNF